DGREKIKSPSSVLSTAEAISVIHQGQALATHFGDGELRAHDLAAGMVGAIVKDPSNDAAVWQEYLETIVKRRADWQDLYRACKDLG
ncbi:MAG TPA: ATPase, partial [Saprospiraceae bacterium]|nr:ATPase [Saprospiraceae bacterium]